MDLRSLRFGVEVETVRRTRSCVAEAIRTVVGGQVRHAAVPRGLDPWEVIDARGESFLDGLQRTKLAVLEEAPDKGISALSRLVQLCADVRFGGDVAAAWPTVQRQMRFNEDERRLIERELGLADAKA